MIVAKDVCRKPTRGDDRIDSLNKNHHASDTANQTERITSTHCVCPYENDTDEHSEKDPARPHVGVHTIEKIGCHDS